MTYKEIQEIYRKQYGKAIKSCWIADAKRDLNQTRRVAYNRIDINEPKYPCPNRTIKDRIIKVILQNTL